MAKKKVRFIVEVDVAINETIESDYDKIKPELVDLQKNTDFRHEKLLIALMDNPELIQACAADIAFQAMDEGLMDHDIIDELEEGSDEAIEEAVNEMEMNDATHFADRQDQNIFKEDIKRIMQNFSGTISSIEIEHI